MGRGVGHKVTAAPAAVTSRPNSLPNHRQAHCNPVDRNSLSLPARRAKSHPNAINSTLLTNKRKRINTSLVS